MRELARMQGFSDDYTFHSESGSVKTVSKLSSGHVSAYEFTSDASTNWKCRGMASIYCNWSTVYPGTFIPEEKPVKGSHCRGTVVLTFVFPYLTGYHGN